MHTVTPDARGRDVVRRGTAFVSLALLLLLASSAPLSRIADAQSTDTDVPGIELVAEATAIVNLTELSQMEARQLPAPPVRVRPFRAVPLHDPPEPPPLPGSTSALPAPREAFPSGALGALVASPAPSLSYAGLDDIPMVDSSYIVIPPDVNGAVGPTKVMESLNNNFRIRDKATGATQLTVGTATFWAPVEPAAHLNQLTDPRTTYDPYNDRWITVMQCVTLNSDVLVGVSQTSDPAGTWYLYRFTSSGSIFLDFPVLGFNKNWIAITINQYTSAGAFSRGRCYAINYPLARTGTGTGTVFQQAGGTHFTTSPCITYSATEDTLFLVTHLSSSGATYQVDRITGTPAAPVYTSGGTNTRPGGGWVQPSGNICPQSAPNAGASVCSPPCPTDVVDSQVRAAPIYRNGFIYYSQTVGLPVGSMTHTGVQWTKVTPSTTPAFAAGGRLEDPTATSSNGGKWYAFPSLSVNSANDFILGFTQYSSAQHPSAGYAIHYASEGLSSLRDAYVYKAGEDYYHKTFGGTRNRWGDFSTSQVDPSDDMTLWTIQEYGKTRVNTDDGNTGSNGSRWATWWAAVGGTPPTVSIAAGPSQNEGNAGTTPFNFTVNLSAPSGSVVTVNYQTADGSATVADNDYVAATSSINIPAGNTSGTITIDVNGDTKYEANETFTVTLTGATNATLGSPTVSTGTILNDDAQPTVSIDDVMLSEGNAGTTTFGFTVSLSAVSGLNTSVDYQTADGTATLANNDYQTAAGTASIPAGSLAAPVNVLVNGDLSPEPTEDFAVNLTNPVNASFGDPQGIGTIVDDDAFTGTLISQFRLEPLADGSVALHWQFGDPSRIASSSVERATSLDGPWSPVQGQTQESFGSITLVDHEASSGQTYYYRLVVNLVGGGTTIAGPLTRIAGETITQFALAPVVPNPSGGNMVKLEWALPTAASAQVIVVDVRGRRVAELARGIQPAGRYSATWDGRVDGTLLPPGMYFLRMRVAGKELVQRFALTR